ncbi:aldo/keto reductase [Hydrogenobacter thermophilus TK-6]|uniref:Aldo/keto reductase n=1 Tax=Hydrogenobacter thermophilus (strain DSM 6534 / IAM 12695 / TK-6) TaxID=608538 RepID=D3DJI8_HYDTT|nr:aldo/keto reductase [Hydrogenobacter thermophilus]ADO45913.1 aldo/keto reductase [Hydrogenobacter thermophilus TK-6]BAI69990.1 aldo/keto reductase [Hydrogenobacter thermophilus TK-6]
MIEKFVLGTANFGMKYGIAFKGRVEHGEAMRILERSQEAGIWGVDTAMVYGSAEEVLGEFFERKGKTFRIINKLPHKNYTSEAQIYSTVKESLKKLKVDHIDFLLLHSYKTFKSHPKLVIDALRNLKNEGIIKHYGISVYHPQEFIDFYTFCGESVAVEFPLNAFDRRFTKYLREWKSEGFILFARSVFLQGLFFLKRFEGNFKKVESKVKALKKLAEGLGMDLPCLLLSFVASFEELDGIVVGVDGLSQLEMNIRCLRELTKLNLEGFEVDDEDIILPYMWDS